MKEADRTKRHQRTKMLYPGGSGERGESKTTAGNTQSETITSVYYLSQVECNPERRVFRFQERRMVEFSVRNRQQN